MLGGHPKACKAFVLADTMYTSHSPYNRQNPYSQKLFGEILCYSALILSLIHISEPTRLLSI